MLRTVFFWLFNNSAQPIWPRHIALLSVALAAYVVFQASKCQLNWLWWDWMLISGGVAFLIVIILSLRVEGMAADCLTNLHRRAVITGSSDDISVLIEKLQDRCNATGLKGAKVFVAAEFVLIVAAMVVIPFFEYESVEFFYEGSLVTFHTEGVSHFIRLAFEEGIFVLFCLWCGYLAGLRMGIAVGYGGLAGILDAENISWRAMPGHPDGAAGLKPVGNLFLYEAILIAVPLVWLAAWWVLAGSWPGVDDPVGENCKNAIDYRHWRNPFIGLWLLVGMVMTVAFVVPVRSFHSRMRIYKDNEIPLQMDELSVALAETESAYQSLEGDPAKLASITVQRQNLTERLHALETMPVWPTGLQLTVRFLIYEGILFFGPILVDVAIKQDTSGGSILNVILQILNLLK